jgi:hypothetical protein
MVHSLTQGQLYLYLYLFTFERLGVFENRVLRRIFGPEREEDESW